MKNKTEFSEESQKLECPVQHAHQFIGGKWRIGILWHLKENSQRFGELKRHVSGISEKMLIQELKHLQDVKAISRKAFPEIPPRVEYSLTEKGKSLIPLVESVVNWGSQDLENDLFFKENSH